MTEEEIDLEREKNEAFELGRIAALEELEDELRDRAGRKWAYADGRMERRKAQEIRALADELDEKASRKRESWEEKYRS